MPNLCSKAEVKGYLKITDTSDDSRIDSLIAAVSVDLPREMQRADLFEQKAYTDRFYWGDYPNGEVFTKNWPIQEILSVKNALGEEQTESADGIAAGWFFDDQLTPEDRSKICFVGQWVWPGVCDYDRRRLPRVPALIVEYEAGYAEVPADVKQAAIEWVAYKLGAAAIQTLVADSDGPGGVSIGDYSQTGVDAGVARYTQESAIPDSVQRVIDSYKRARL